MSVGAPNTPEPFEGITLAEVADRFGWDDSQTAAHLAELAAIPPYQPTAGDFERLAQLARVAESDESEHLTS